jgi:arylsulfatase
MRHSANPPKGGVRNILFITTDQQRRDSLPCYGQNFVRSPALDSLARDGVVFENCSAVAPVCQPCRASFMTGQYPHVTGVPENFRWIREESPTIARTLSAAGWRTAAIGKMHFQPWDAAEGFEERIIAEDKRHIFIHDDWAEALEKEGYRKYHPAEVEGYGNNLGAIVNPLPEEMHVDSFIGRSAVDWITRRGGTDDRRPYFLWVSFNSPHDPYDPPSSWADLYRDAPIPEPVGSADELDSKPAYQHGLIPFYRNNLLYLTDYSRLKKSTIRRIREHYFATISLVDRQIEALLKTLDDSGEADSTLVVFSSDHGDMLGDHGLPFKSTFYESSLMVPLIVRGPGVPAGGRSRAAVNWLDLHATFLAAAGIDTPAHVQGRDITPLLASPGTVDTDEAFSELEGSCMIRTERYKLVLCDNGDGELYDLEEEPQEVRNHFNDQAYSMIQSELSEKITCHLLSHSRVGRFGGGRIGTPDALRAACFADIQKRLDEDGYPGLR